MTFLQSEEELHSAGESLLSGEWTMMSAANRRKLIDSFCRGYVLPPLSVSMATVYRARRNEGRTYFSNVKELYAPPPQYAKMGRLNRDNTSVLYLSATPHGAISEIDLRLGDLVSVVACKMRDGADPLVVAPLAMTELSPGRALGPVSETTKAGPLGFRQLRELIERFKIDEQWNYQQRVLNHLITLEASEGDKVALYELTNAIADHIMNHFPLFDTLEYPGIKMRLAAPNLAIYPKRWNDIEACEVWVMRFDQSFLMNNPALPKLYASKLELTGLVQPDGSIAYRKTDKTILSAWGDFKQKRLSELSIPTGLKPLLSQPFVRRRIRWDIDPRNYDFTMPEWP